MERGVRYRNIAFQPRDWLLLSDLNVTSNPINYLFHVIQVWGPKSAVDTCISKYVHHGIPFASGAVLWEIRFGYSYVSSAETIYDEVWRFLHYGLGFVMADFPRYVDRWHNSVYTHVYFQNELDKHET